MSRIVISHPESYEKLTARLFWKLTSESGYIDAGNVREYADATARSLVTRFRTTNGVRHVNAEQADVNHEAFTFLLDERNPEQDKLIRLARNRDDHQQAAVEATTANIESVQAGRWFDVGAWNIANVQVSGSLAGVLDEGTDYELDTKNGRIHVLTGGAVASGETLHLTFDQPGMSLEKSESQYSPLFHCDIILEETSQWSKMFLRRHVFRANLNVTEFPNQAGEYASYRVKATADGPITTFKRPEAATLPTATATVESAGKSSSSSSSSSTFSSSSSSSSSSGHSSSSSTGSGSSGSSAEFGSFSSSSSSESDNSSSSSTSGSGSSGSSGSEGSF